MTLPPDPIVRLWRSVQPPDRNELRSLARAAAAGSQSVAEPHRRRFRARWAIAATAALLIGSGLGFSLGSTVTPSGTAGRNVIGFGFLPDPGWKVVQTAGPGSGATSAVASKGGMLISVTSTPRGDPAEDVAYAVRDLPMQVADARRLTGDRTLLQLRAGVGGYNIDARISFGATPTSAMLAAAQKQLNRLVVAADRVTIAVRPVISSPLSSMVDVFGTIDSGKAGESVTVQAKECGNTFFRVYAGASTEAGGSWSTVIYPNISMQLRAVWNGETSTEVTFRRRAFIGFQQLSKTRFRVVHAGYGTRFEDKQVNVQSFDQRLGKWKTVRRVRMTSSYQTYVTLRMPKDTRLRAVLPNSQAGPCYLGGTSPVIRT